MQARPSSGGAFGFTVCIWGCRCKTCFLVCGDAHHERARTRKRPKHAPTQASAHETHTRQASASDPSMRPRKQARARRTRGKQVSHATPGTHRGQRHAERRPYPNMGSQVGCGVWRPSHAGGVHVLTEQRFQPLRYALTHATGARTRNTPCERYACEYVVGGGCARGRAWRPLAIFTHARTRRTPRKNACRESDLSITRPMRVGFCFAIMRRGDREEASLAPPRILAAHATQATQSCHAHHPRKRGRAAAAQSSAQFACGVAGAKRAP